MLISTWLTAVRNRLQAPRVLKRRQNQKQASQASENLETRALLTTTLQAVRPNVGEFLTPGEIRTVAPQELTLQFSLGSTITPTSISNQSIQVFRSGVDGISGNVDDVPITIGYVGTGSVPNEVVLRFGETLVDDKYRIVVNGTGTNALAATIVTSSGVVADPVANSTFDFELDLGARIVAVDPQPVSRDVNGNLVQARNQIVLYFNDDDLSPTAAQTLSFYKLIATKETVSSLDDVVHNPTGAVYSAASNTVTLTFAQDIALLSGAGSYRLRVGNSESLPIAPSLVTPGADPGSSFGTANTSLGAINASTNSSTVISSSISPQFVAFSFPGANDEPGHREIEVENHLGGGADTGASGIPFIEYNFKSNYGFDPSGNPLSNLITPDQKDRAREVFAYYSEKSGIDFRETASSGLTVVTGDMRALDPAIPTGPGGVAGLAGGGMAIMDMAETWSNLPGESWFNVAMHEIGHLLGQGHTYDLPDPTVQGAGSSGSSGTGVEPTLAGDHDIVHMQHMYRPDSVDIDLYRFQTTTTSIFSAEVMAERMSDSSTLDSVLRLYREVGGVRELVAQNDNYFSKDSFLELTLTPGTYYIGVSSTGNDSYDPTIQNTGSGGTSQGVYDLRVNFRPNVSGAGSAIVDTTGRTFDGDNDGVQGGVYNFWFKTAAASDTLFVDKSAGTFTSNAVSSSSVSTIVVDRTSPFIVNDVIRVNNEQMRITGINATTRTLTVTRGVNGTTATTHSVDSPIRLATENGSLATPFSFIGDAFAAASAGDVVRIVGNGGIDGNSSTLNDSLPYEIGLNTSNQPLADGASLEVPKGVTVMVDKGAVLKLRRSWLGTGSSTTSVDRSGSALQVLGVPGRQVIMTSWNDETIGTDTTAAPTTATEGDWGGIIFRNEIDRAQNRFNAENEGIFLNYVGYADLRWGGGSVSIDSVTQTINPIHIDRSQPTIVNNILHFNKDSAMSADPDSFEEVTFHSPRFQSGKPAFTVDYKRVGPDISGNTLLSNGNNALFVRMDTVAGGGTQKLTVPGRFNDTDIVHVVAQNLEIQGTPGGAFRETVAPSVTLVTLTSVAGGTLAAGTYSYRVVFTDENGFESPASAATGTIVLAATGSVRLAQLPQVQSGSVYTGRRIYRSSATGAGTYTLIADLDKTATTFVDTGITLQRTLPALPTNPRDRARLDARLSIDPGIVVKLQGARIEAEMGAQLIAEGSPGRQVIFTSRLDDRYGAGGTFDTNNDDSATTETTPSAGNWGGLYIGHLGSGSIDRALVTFGGGSVPVGGSFAAFNPVEIHEAKVRIRNTTFESNASGASSGTRSGLFSNASGTIFVRGAQPVLLDNTFVGNAGPIININVNALNKNFVVDTGRSTGVADLELSYGDNQGPLIRDNVLEGNGLNGMIVRGETLTTQSIWDDTDIVHIVQSEIYVPNLHTYGGIRLESSPTESLVVKLSGPTAGFTAGGSKLDITDRIGGMLHLVGQPGQPVILTSLKDDTVGAGNDLQGLLQKDTNGDGASVAAAGDWRGVNVERYSHDRNVAVYVENEIADRQSADTNATPSNAEDIGALAHRPQWGDENLRLGVDLQGFIDSPGDVDVYSFSGVAGSQVWIDIDRTSYGLDSVVELLDSTGTILAQSDNYYNEKIGTWQVVTSPAGDILANGLDYSPYLSDDHYSTNGLDAGFRVILPGTDGTRGTFWIRVRSSNIDSATAAPRTNLQDSSKVGNGLTSGVYQLQVRLQEEDEFAGTTIQYADIRFATTGVNIIGQPSHSPLAGESEEVEGTTGQLGNLMDSDRGALAVRGTIGAVNDVDFYQFQVNYTHTQQIGGVSLTAPHVPVVFDLDYADGLARADMTMAIYDSAGRLVLIGRDSNITDDQSGPQEGSDTDDLTRGSVGTFDPFVGSVELPGGTYSLAVFNNRQVPAVLDQYFTAASSSPLLRVEPINSTNRIFEERFGAADNDTYTSANAPTTNLFTVGANGALDPRHTVDYHLGDVVLFVSSTGGTKNNDESTVRTINPFTGSIVTTLGSFGQSSGDIAMRADGELFTFSTGAGNGTPSSSDNSGNTGNYLRIDTGTAEVASAGDDGIAVNLDNGNPGDDTIVGYGNGVIQYNAMTYTGTADKSLFAIGNRFDHNLPANSNVANQYSQNILYQFDIRTGAVNGQGNDRVATGSQAATNGAGTTQREIGQIRDSVTNLPLAANIVGMAFMPAFAATLTMPATPSATFIVDTLGNLYTLNMGTARATLIANMGLGLGETFTSLSVGPDEVEAGVYRNTLFAMTNLGNLMAFDTSGNPAPVFYDGQSVVPTGVFGSTGIAFSTLDRNLWETTTNRGNDPGHGVETRFDDSVLSNRQDGGRSLYFGNQRSGASAGNKNNLGSTSNGLVRDVNFPGGAHGSVVSNEFSLQGYNRNDKPMLYFNYYLQTENALYDPDTNAPILMRDAFRVFVADESGEWNLVSTNNSYDNSNRLDEFDYGPDGSATQAPVTQTFPDVVETFDNTTTWRQARIDLSNYAGRSNLRLRFDFSTAASMGLGNTLTTGSELRAVDGSKLRDGDIFTIDGVDFEFELGSTIVMPTGATAIGKSFTVGGQTFTFAAAAGGANTIVVLATDSPSVVATKAANVVNTVLGAASALLPTVADSNRLTFPGQTVTGATAGLTVNGAAGVAATSNPVVVTPDMTANEVALVIRQALADEFSAGDITNIKGAEELIWIIGHDVDANGPLGFADTLPGDSFGAFNASFSNSTGNRPGSLRGMNNAVEGVYVDDIVLGFAERGEMVINAAANQGFTVNRDIEDAYPSGNVYLGVDVGEYDVEIRRASDYGLTLDASPTNLLYKAIDTNDREAELVSVAIPAASLLADGSTITISDGVNQVIFQFLDARGATTPLAGAFPIFFNPAFGLAGDQDGEAASSIATRLRDAINSPTVQSVLRIKASLSDGADTGTSSTSSQLHLTSNAIVTASAAISANVVVTRYLAFGDQNHHRDQGQLIVRSSSITDSSQYGIVADAAPRAGGLPGPGSVRNLHTVNDEGIVTGVVIMNNVIAANGAGGIRFSGDQVTSPNGQVPYGRIVNNTIVGIGSGTGILVEQSASPTILNNIIADFTNGINVDASSAFAGTTIGSTLYSGNTNNSNVGLGTFPIVLGATEPLFVDKANRNYYPAPLSRAIDSSLTSLGDRDAILRIKQPMDLDGLDDKGSPIIAPEFDLYGQLRGNDPAVETPTGQGASVLFDRGAIDRVDFFQPQAQLVNPEDQSALDGDPDFDEVWIDQVQTLRQFRIRLNDEGIGIDHRTVNKNQFVLKRVGTDGVTETTLIEGIDYQFSYNEVTREVVLTAATFFADADTEVRYILLVDNDGTGAGDTVNGPRDLAGNFLLSNKADGTTRFDIVLTDGVNDRPTITAPATATVLEDRVLTFAGGSLSVFDQDAHLGTNILTVTLTATNGLLSLSSIPVGLTVTPLTGLNAATLTMTGRVQLLNTALSNLSFRPTADYFGAASIAILAEDFGEFSGAPAQNNATVNITVTPDNDVPTFNAIAANPPAVTEDAGPQQVSNFLTGITAGPANEAGQTVTANVSIISENSAWTVNNFFAAGGLPTLSIVGTTATLNYRTAPDVNGTVTVQVQLNDGQSSNNLSVARTFVITVTPLNDAPVRSPKFTAGTNPARILINGTEDASLVQNINVPLVNSFAMGPATALDETAQQPLWSRINFVRTSGNLVFDVLQVRPDGSLDYRARKDTAGTATFDVLLQDNGVSGGLNVNSAQPFSITITIAEQNDSPVAITPYYVIDEGYALNLDASRSYDVDAPFGDTLTYAWDLNNDGDYADAGEASGNLPTRTVTWAQLASLGITAPQTRTIKLRVTDSRNATNSTTVVTTTLFTQIVDYGDAPDSYGTLKGSNGASHVITGNLLLGTTRDKEIDGQPGPNANLDGADEDGVTFPTSLETSNIPLPTYVDVVSSGAGKLNIWLDLNQDGDFDVNEHLNGGVPWTVVAGVNRINFVIPAGTPAGDSMMRFRLTSVGHPAITATGRASDGEVEDYSVKIRQLQAPVSPTISRPVDFNPADGQIAQTTDSTPTITWSLHEANFKYALDIRNASNVSVYSRTAQSNFTAISDTVTSSLPEGVYTIHLTAYNKANVAATTTVVQFRVVKVAVASPTGSQNTSRPTIMWNHVPGSRSYTIEIYSSPSNTIAFRQTVLTTSMATPGQFTLPTNLPLGTYFTRIQAADAVGLLGDWSANQFFQVRTAPVISQPTGTVITPLPSIAWSAVTGAVSYDVRLYNLTDNTLVASVTGVQGTSWSPTTPLLLARYQVVVTARGAAGFLGLTSNPLVFNYAPVPRILAPGGRLEDSTPTFGWEAVPAANLYRLVVRQDFGNFLEVYRHNSLTTTIHELPFSLPIGRYTFSVVAINTATAGTGQPDAVSSPSLETTFAVVTPPTVLGLQGTSGPVATTFLTRPTVLWTNPAGTGSTATSQLLLFRKDGPTNVLILNQSNISGTSLVTPTLGLGTYVVQVRTTSSADPATVSNWSIEKTFRVTVAPTLIGPNTAISDSTPTLNWAGVTGGQTYQIEVTRLPGNVVAFAQSGLNALNYTVPSDLPIGLYRFRVQARTAFGELSSWSDTMDFQIVGGPTLTGPASSTFITRPSFSWTNMSGTVGGTTTVVPVYDFRLDAVLPNNVVQANFRTATGLTSPSLTLPTALPVGRYRAMVLARTSDTTSNYSNVVEFYVGGNPVVNPIVTTTDTTPTISWKAVDGASGYQIFIALDSSPSVPVLQQMGIGSLSYTPTIALAKGKYRVWVRAVNASNGQLSGPSLTEPASIIFTITDASETQPQQLSGQYTLAMLPVNMDDVVSETAISMLPAYVSGAQQPVMVVSEQTVDGNVQLKASAQDATENSVDVAPENVPQTDEVLSQWDEQKWWDAEPTAVVSAEASVSEPQAVTSASSGILGALLALAPRSLRRRKKDESAK